MKSVRKDGGIVSAILGPWRRGIARACRWRHDGAVIPGSKRGLSPVIVPHLLLTLLLVLAFASPAWAALSRVSKASAQANSVAITTPSVGDLILVFAHRDGSTTAPTLATNYTNINSSGANTNSSRIGYKISDGTETTSGTWTNATSVAVVVYRGQHATTPIGATGSGGASSNAIAYNTFTLQVTDGTSWVVGVGGHRTATNVGQAPTGMQLQTSATDVAASDTNGGVSSWSTQSVTVNASSGWSSWAIEIRATPPLPFTYRKQITIDHQKVGTGATTLTDYPFLFNVTDTNLKTVANGGHVTDAQGDDIIFRAVDPTTCNDGNVVCTLDHEIESYDPTTGKLVAWARIPSVNAFSASSDTVIYIYYGNSWITTSTQNPTGVWNANYNAVWHLKENPAGTAPQMKDSTTNALHATSTGSMTLSQQVAGQINGSLNFDGTNDGLNIPSYTIGDTTTGYFTLEAWINETATSGYRNIVNNCPASCTYPNYNRWLGVSSGVITWWDGATESAFGTAGSASTWYHIVVTYNGTSFCAYRNGAPIGSCVSSSYPPPGVTSLFQIGYTSTTTPQEFFQGMIDEVRVSKTARSADWISTEYKNVTLLSCGVSPIDPSKFCIYGTEENNPPSAVHLRGAQATSYEGAFAQTVQLKWRTSHEVDHLGFHVYREQNGQLLRVTPSLLAGSALLARGRTELTAGQRYSWWDVLPANSGPLQYWLEEIDLHGQRTWHGPIAVKSAKGRRDIAGPEQVRSVLLSKLGRGKHKGRLPGAPWQGAADAATQTPTAAQLAVQGQLAAGPAIKLGVSAEGWYRVDQPTLIAAGLDPRVDPRRLQLFVEGREVPLVVTGAQDGRLEPRDAIEFYGVGLDTPWTDIRTYWLVEGQQAGQRVGGNEWRGRTQPGPASFPFTITWQPREL
ncbi:MAG: DUF2341 domain-containing protein, partial [Nitrospirae bacterium]